MDDKHADRAAKQAEQQRNDMLNSKNTYLISIAIANQVKGRFYSEDLPRLEDEYQDLQSRLVQRFAHVLSYCQALQMQHLDVLKSRVESVQSKLSVIDPVSDGELFINYNIRPFTVPHDWKFEPCSGHYDTGDMSVDPAPKVFIQNKLRKCKAKLEEIRPVVISKKSEAGQLQKQLQSYEPDHQPGKIDDIVDSYLDAENQHTYYSISEHILKTEVETIVAAIGSDVGGQHPHQFKSSTFSIPTHCGYCKSAIWGLTKQGKTCKACGVSVHTKCELKFPANCGQPQEVATPTSSLSRSDTSSTARTTKSSLLSVPSSATPTPSSFVQPQADDTESYPSVRAVFDFPAGSEFELAVRENETLQMVEPDDGSGWVKVQNANGQSGLVPATYVEETTEGWETMTPAPAKSLAGSAQRVRALYDYQSQGPDELPLVESEIVELSDGPQGGKNYADGWWEGFNAQRRKGIFPSNYVEDL
ncbi:hypothetical protein BKA70DRAFT_778610 [Coprinopsis sp. MPI-PUGE-AT-0042]|nr:hypothetical protein BKA70DRAFT_778610 [Coprinopsis sp. MPI-PUGE-AT-0042]